MWGAQVRCLDLQRHAHQVPLFSFISASRFEIRADRWWGLSRSQSSMVLHIEHRHWDIPPSSQQRPLAARRMTSIWLFSISKLFRSYNILEIGFLLVSLHLVIANLSVYSSARNRSVKPTRPYETLNVIIILLDIINYIIPTLNSGFTSCIQSCHKIPNTTHTCVTAYHHLNIICINLQLTLTIKNYLFWLILSHSMHILCHLMQFYLV